MANYLYIAGAEDGPVKIGITQNPQTRLRSLNCASPIKLSMVAFFETDMYSRDLERTIHFVLREKRLNGEWFNLTPADAIRQVQKTASTAECRLDFVSMSDIIDRYPEIAAMPEVLDDSDLDDSELTDDELTQARPFAEAFPALAESIKRSRGRPKTDAAREAVTLRVAPETLARFKAKGEDWRQRMVDVLNEAKP